MAHRYLLTFLCSLLCTLGIAPGLSSPIYGGGASKALHFIENKGQITDQYGAGRNDIDFKIATGNGLNIFLGKGVIHYQWVKGASNRTSGSAAGGKLSLSPAPVDNGGVIEPAQMYRMDVQLLGANKNAVITTEDEAVYFERYYLSWAGSNGALAHSYRKVIYHDIYPQIDWVFYINGQGKLEHDFIVRPGGKVSDIKLKYGGTTSLTVSKDGSLTAVTPVGIITEHIPYAYEQSDKKKIVAAFVVDNDLLTFSTDAHRGTLVIDPTLEWATYFGGNDYDETKGVQAGKDSSLYIVGSTISLNNIATTGSFQSTFGGGWWFYGADAFISKFASDGTCIWATYFGGSDNDNGNGISMDTSGNLYVAGYAYSVDVIATAGVHKDAKPGSDADLFLCKFDTSGARIWGTYFGGAADDGILSALVTCDKSGHVYLAGSTQSTDGIASSGAFQSTIGGASDAFLAKFDTSGALVFGTYYGGSNDDYSYGITTDTTENILLTGPTGSTDGMASPGSYQSALGGNDDAFLVKFSHEGLRLWGTYFGGSEIDWSFATTCDKSGNIYIAGTTLSLSGIATTNSFQSIYGGGSQDGFLSKFNTAGQIVWSTYYGGTGDEACTGLYYSGNTNKVYVTGNTSSTDGIATPESVNVNLSGPADAFLSSFDTAGSIGWGSYFGGSDGETGNALTSDNYGNLYLVGGTASATGVATPEAYQTVFGGYADGLIMKIKDCEIPVIATDILGPVELCAGSIRVYTVPSVPGALSYNWILPNGWTGSSSDDSITVTTGELSGTIKVTALNYCTTSDTASINVTIKPLPIPEINANGHILATTQIYVDYQWNLNGQPITGATGATHIATANGNYTVTVTANNGCSATSPAFTVSDITGIDNVPSLSGITIYPNPSSAIVSVDVADASSIRIVDINGRTLQNHMLKPGISQIDISALSNGIYGIKVFKQNNIFIGSMKFVKAGK